MKRFAAILAGLAMLGAACGGSDPDEGIARGTSATSAPAAAATTEARASAAATATPAPVTATPTPTATPERPAPSMEVAFFSANAERRLMRFVGLIKNPSTKTIEGLKVRWDAFAADNALVGSFTANMPAIAGGQTFNYVGGAGAASLTGVPASVKLTVVDGGRLTDAPSGLFAVEPATVQEETFSNGKEFRASGNVTTPDREIERFNLVINVVFRDASGAIVGAGFDSGTGLPEKIPPATKFRAELRLIEVTARATTAEITAYAVSRF